MIGNAFLKRLSFQLDFLDEEDRNAVLQFYQKKLSAAATLVEEEEIVKSFGDPAKIAEAVRSACHLDGEADADNTSDDALPDSTEVLEEVGGSEPAVSAEDPDGASSNSELDEDEENNASSPDAEEQSDALLSGSDEDDLIFSKPAAATKAPEIIHSLEDREIKTLYGERVTIEENKNPIEEIPLEPLDRENGMTPEEIELAKRETLEKASRYNTTTFGIPENQEETPVDCAKAPQEEPEKMKDMVPQPPPEEPEVLAPLLELEEEEERTADCAEEENREDVKTPEEEKKRFPGVLRRPFRSSNLSEGAIRAFLALFTLILSPVLLAIFAGLTVLYVAVTFTILLLSVLLFLIMAALIIGGIVELVYGVSLLFDAVSVALIELGIGTALFAIVTAIAALIYEFLFGVMPSLLKKITRFSFGLFRRIGAYLYGGTV